eukprot:16288-Heterococcus_DN1.PRE.5
MVHHRTTHCSSLRDGQHLPTVYIAATRGIRCVLQQTIYSQTLNQLMTSIALSCVLLVDGPDSTVLLKVYWSPVERPSQWLRSQRLRVANGR